MVIRTGVGVKGESELHVIVLPEVDQNRSRLEHGKIVAVSVDEDGDAAVGVEPDEPWLLLRFLRNIYLVNTICVRAYRQSDDGDPRNAFHSLIVQAIYSLQLLEEDRHLPASRRGRGIQQEWLVGLRRGQRHGMLREKASYRGEMGSIPRSGVVYEWPKI